MASATKHKAHVSDEKKEVVNDFAKLIEKYNVIGAVDLENLPARQLQSMKTQLRGKVLIRMTKRRLLNIAIDKSKKQNIQALKPKLQGMPAILFSNENPFELYSILKKNKSKAPIKGGQKAPQDIVVKAGPTSFAPGPVIGELGAFKIKTGIEGGKVAIKEDCIVAKEGEIVSSKLASILLRLGIEPMEIGLNLVAVWEQGDILTRQVLDIDEDAFKASITTAAAEAINLAFNAGFPTKETITLMIQKASANAKALALSQDIITSDTVSDILGKAERQAAAINAAASSHGYTQAQSSGPDSESNQADK